MLKPKSEISIFDLVNLERRNYQQNFKIKPTVKKMLTELRKSNAFYLEKWIVEEWKKEKNIKD